MMKRCALILALLLLLSACGAPPSRTADGEPWDKSWEVIGSTLGVEDPGNGFTLLDNNAILTAQDTFLSTWTCGAPESYTNADGEEANLYDAELFVLLEGCKDAANAQTAVESWRGMAETSYTVLRTYTETHSNQEYTVLIYTCGSDTNPYDRGVAVYTVYGNYAITAELTCRDRYTGDEAAVLSDFLDGFHFAEA